MAVFADACKQRNSHFSYMLSSGADGHVSGTVDYDIFGKPVTETGVFVSSSGGMSALVFGYAGKPYDPVTGLSDYGFRDYAPSLARFTTVDPIRDGSNWYAYCNADPVNYVDMWGLCESDKDSHNSGSFSPKTSILKEFLDIFSIDFSVGLQLGLSFISDISINAGSMQASISSNGYEEKFTIGVSSGLIGVSNSCDLNTSRPAINELHDNGDLTVNYGALTYSGGKDADLDFSFGFKAVVGVEIHVSSNEFFDFINKIGEN